MTVFLFMLTIAVIVLFVMNSRNQSGIISLKKEVILLKKTVKELKEELVQKLSRVDEPIQEQATVGEQEIVHSQTTVADQETVHSQTIVADHEIVHSQAIVQIHELVQDNGRTQAEKISEVEKKHAFSNFKFDTKSVFSIESILTKLGILLFLIGLGYLYKLAYDNGFITKGLSVVFGEIVGVGIIGLGYYVIGKQRAILGQVLFGGGIAALYIVTYVGYNSYDLYPGFFAFSFFSIITVIAFYIALSLDSKTMGVIGILGALLTPFFVDISYIGFFGMGIYLFILSVGAMVIYFFKRWRVLQLSTIIGVYFVTLILHSYGGFSDTESIQFSLLLLALFLVFNGLDYILYYLDFETIKSPIISVILFMAIPLITILHIVDLLDFTQVQWGVLFLIVALIYIGAYVLLYRKRGHMLVSDILIGYVGVFVFTAIVLSLGGDIRIIIVLLLSLMFFALNKKLPHFSIVLVAYCIYGIGFVWALIDFATNLIYFEGMSEIEFKWITVFVQICILLVLFGGVLFQKKRIRKIQGSLVLLLYGVPVILRAAFEIGEDFEPISVLLVTIALILWGLMILYERFKCISIITLITTSALPLLYQLGSVEEYFYNDEMPIYVLVIGVLYCINLFVIGLYMSRSLSKVLINIIRILAYSMLSINLCMYMYILTEQFIFGHVLVGLFIIGLLYFEKEPIDRIMRIYLLIMNIGFIVISYIYGMADSHSYEINYYIAVGDIVLLLIIARLVYELKIVSYAKFIIHIFIYMLLVYQNLYSIDKGIITLLWAAYGIIGLFITVYKKKREETYVSLGMILIVAVKFILVDLSSVEPVYKVITSMVFGIALLVLSYFIQPILSRKDE